MGAYLGAAIAMGFGAVGTGIGEGYISGKANAAVARQPGQLNFILRVMLLGQAVAETAGILALTVALILLFQQGKDTILQFIAYLSAGITMGIGSFAPGIAAALPAGSTCEAVARDPKTFGNVFITMLMGQAITQAAVIYAFVIAMLMIFTI